MPKRASRDTPDTPPRCRLAGLGRPGGLHSEGSPQAAIRFLANADESFRLLARSPELGGLCVFDNPRTVGLRVWRVKGFPNHLIFYRVIEGGIEVVRVLHGARDIEAVFEEDA